ncbi:MAG: CYTH domain-containing protein [bacterium]|nr:CYTH domain-containing protein [bacterium]
MEYREIEAKFLEIDVQTVMGKLREIGAIDDGDDFLREIIFYDKAGRWQYEEKKFVRVRQAKKGIFVTFKHNEENSVTGTKEVEFEVKDVQIVKKFLEEIGLIAFREQEKKRHTFRMGKVIIDIDTWPSVPTYVELEGPSEEELKKVAVALGLEWSKAIFESARYVIEKHYKIPVSKYRQFTFKKIG